MPTVTVLPPPVTATLLSWPATGVAAKADAVPTSMAMINAMRPVMRFITFSFLIADVLDSPGDVAPGAA